MLCTNIIAAAIVCETEVHLRPRAYGQASVLHWLWLRLAALVHWTHQSPGPNPAPCMTKCTLSSTCNVHIMKEIIYKPYISEGVCPELALIY